MSIADGKHVMMLCICPRCRNSHQDVLPEHEARRYDGDTKRAPRVVCDVCFGRSSGPAAMRAYQALKAKLKGEECT